MPYTINMPKLSPTMEDGTIAKWHKKEGEKIEPGDVLIEVATDKATVEHSAIDPGWLRKILIKEGEEASVNQPIAICSEQKDESLEGFEVPKEKVEEEVVEEKEEKEEPAKEKPKAAKETGMLQPKFEPLPPLEEYSFEMPTESLEKRLKASPLAKKLAKEKGLDLTTVKGTGPGKRIMSYDLERAQKTGTVVFGRREKPKEKPGSYEEKPLSQMRKVIAKRLQEAKTFIPHFYVTQIVTVEPLATFRDSLRHAGIKLTYNDFVIRAAALALREHPDVNCGFNSVNQTLIQFKTIDIAFAVGIEEGLITPIIRHADYKNLGEISVEARMLAKRAKEGKLALEEFQGGSFTVSNLGMYGVTEFSAIINPPQAAVLAVGGVSNVAVIKNGQVVPGKVMRITLSSDHRVVDGVLSAQFIKTVQKYLENPAILIV